MILWFIKKRKRLTIKSNDVSFKIKFGSNINVGKGTFIDHNCEIGSYTFIGKNCNISKATIGRYCSIANNVSIGPGEHDLTKISTSSIFYKNAYEKLTKKLCIIGNDVWIGTDVIVLRGVKIGNGAVIGANSVVTKDVPPFSIFVGSPAKFIRYRFDNAEMDKIEKSKWWEYDINKAKTIIYGLENER